MYAFTMYVAVWLPDILVESSTGTRNSMTVLYDTTGMSFVQLLTTRELPLGCFKATRYTALLQMIRVREKIIKDIFEMLICFSRRIVLFCEYWWHH